MSISIVVGGQYGSEGKGKVSYFWAKKMNASAVVRVGGSNSGHTVYDVNGEKHIFRMLPTSSILGNVTSILPAGSYIDVPVLLSEVNCLQMDAGKIMIDPNAVIIKEEFKSQELAMNLRENIGSTLSGTGLAVIERIKRDKNSPVLMAKDVLELSPYLGDTKKYMNQLISSGQHIVIEGTQGYGLSNYHTKNYPYATSRDTTAAGFLAETGLSPLDVKYVVLVIRSFPIRVAGNSGPLKNEIDWATVSMEAGAPCYFEEKTTVTDKIRRVARFDLDVVKEAIAANNPNIIVLNHLDYIDFSNKNCTELSEPQISFVNNIEKAIGRRINGYGNGEMCIISSRGTNDELQQTE